MNKKIKNEDHNNLWKNKSKGIRNTKELIENGFIDSSEKYFVSEIRKELDVKVPLEFKNQITKGDLELKLQFVPNQKELNIYPEEKQDPIGDESHSPVVGISHRYKDRVLFKPTYQCAVYCRFCFRKYKVSKPKNNLNKIEIAKALNYIKTHKEINEVIFSGGDPLYLSDSKIQYFLDAFSKMKHIKIIRFHTRIPTVLPERVTSKLISILKSSSQTLWIVTHINSHKELTTNSKKAISQLVNSGIPLLSQSVLLKGVNDSKLALKQLFLNLIQNRIMPYYLHYPDLAKGTEHFRIPLENAISLVSSLRGEISGFAIPQLIIDLPEGKGKINVNNNWIVEKLTQNSWKLKSPLTGEEILVSYPS